MKTTRSCGKVRYRDRLDALIALASCQRQDGSRRGDIEKRAYRCRCNGWHLTSQEKQEKAS